MGANVSGSTRFRARVERKSDDLPRYIVLPADAVSDLALERTSTVEGSIAGVAVVRQAVKPWGGGRWFIDVKAAVCEKAGVDTGDDVEVELHRVSEEPPADLLDALAANPTASLVWDRLTRSQKRQVVNDVLRAKRPDTRAKRITGYIDELAAAPSTHRHKYGDLAPDG